MLGSLDGWMSMDMMGITCYSLHSRRVSNRSLTNFWWDVLAQHSNETLTVVLSFICHPSLYLKENCLFCNHYCFFYTRMHTSFDQLIETSALQLFKHNPRKFQIKVRNAASTCCWLIERRWHIKTHNRFGFHFHVCSSDRHAGARTWGV